MKLKSTLIAAAVALVAATGANAATIDNGSNGDGGLFFNVWDATGSYTLNLGIDLDTFEANTSLSVVADTTLIDFLAGKTSYNWNIMAVDFQGAKRILETTNPAATLKAQSTTQVATASGQTNALVTAINGSLATANSATFTPADSGYIAKGSAGISMINTNIGVPTAALGTEANNSFANGLYLMEAKGNASGVAKVPFANLNASARAYFDGNTLTVAAVPEPETYAMLLAGLGLMGFIARRRTYRA